MRNKRALCATLAGVAIAAQASAQAVPDARPSWIDDGRQLPQPKLTDIGIPRTIGLLTLKQLTDFGSARDAVAQYLSDDGQIEATVYLYENSAADALLAKIATDRVVKARFEGSAPRESVVPLGGKQGAALRSAFANGTLPGRPGTMSSASLFAQTLFTVIKVRVSGPGGRDADIAAALDALIKGFEFRKKTLPLPVSRASLPQCPTGDDAAAATAIAGPLPADRVTTAGMDLIGGEPQASDALGAQACIEPTPPETNVVLLRGRGNENDRRVAMLGDGGTTITVRPIPALDGAAHPFVTLYSTRGLALFGPFDRTPSASQFVALSRGEAGWLGAPLVEARFDATGNFTISMNTARMQDAGAKAK